MVTLEGSSREGNRQGQPWGEQGKPVLTAAERVCETDWACADPSPLASFPGGGWFWELCFARVTGKPGGAVLVQAEPQLLKWWGSEKPRETPQGRGRPPPPQCSLPLCIFVHLVNQPFL